MKNSKGVLATVLIIALLVIDQVIKISVKTSMPLYDTIEITSWFKIHFIENNGMAYGMSFVPKIALSLFRVVAVALLCYFIARQVRKNARTIFIVLLSLIIAGAAGNIFDSLFYGLVFDESTPVHISQWVPFGSGYAPCLQGRVVDMFYFPLFTTTLPEWFPVSGGQPYTFFSPVFNFADACISVGVVSLFLFCRKELGSAKSEEENKEEKSSDEKIKEEEIIEEKSEE